MKVDSAQVLQTGKFNSTVNKFFSLEI